VERIVYQARDERHPIVVSDCYPLRCLRFGNESRQSAIDLLEPHRLQLAYSRWMMSALLFVPDPRQVLLLGLGGGGLVHFLHHHHPRVRIRAVEPSSTVIRVARDYFGLDSMGGLEIIREEGGRFIRRHEEESYDLVLVDMFGPDGMAAPLFAPSFHTGIRNLLHPGGMAVFNLWGSEKESFLAALQALDRGWLGERIVVRVPDRGNVVVLARPGRFSRAVIRAARARVGPAGHCYGFDLSRIWRGLWRSGPTLLRGFFRSA